MTDIELEFVNELIRKMYAVKMHHSTIDDAMISLCRDMAGRKIALPKEFHTKKHYVLKGITEGLTDEQIISKYSTSQAYVTKIRNEK